MKFINPPYYSFSELFDATENIGLYKLTYAQTLQEKAVWFVKMKKFCL